MTCFSAYLSQHSATLEHANEAHRSEPYELTFSFDNELAFLIKTILLERNLRAHLAQNYSSN